MANENNEAAQEQNATPAQIRELVARRLLPIFIAMLFVYQLIAITFAGEALAIAYLGRVEPRWWTALSALASPVAHVISSEDFLQLIDSFALIITALFAGIFIQRCQHPTTTDAWIVIALLILGIVQTIVLHALPDAELAAVRFTHGKDAVAALVDILKRNANVSLAICGAALGTNVIRSRTT